MLGVSAPAYNKGKGSLPIECDSSNLALVKATFGHSQQVELEANETSRFQRGLEEPRSRNRLRKPFVHNMDKASSYLKG